DVMYLNGYGFPAWRGGPMWQVDNVIGMRNAAEKIKAYAAKYGARWKIAPLIERLAAEGGTFAGVDAKEKEPLDLLARTPRLALTGRRSGAFDCVGPGRGYSRQGAPARRGLDRLSKPVSRSPHGRRLRCARTPRCPPGAMAGWWRRGARARRGIAASF